MSKLVFLRDFDPSFRAAHAEVCANRRPFFLEMMDRILLTDDERAQAYRLRVSLHFKVCPLCNDLSPIESTSCPVCTWHGQFVHDPYDVESRFAELLHQCPSLEIALKKRNAARGMSLRVRFRSFLRKLFTHKRIDLFA